MNSVTNIISTDVTGWKFILSHLYSESASSFLNLVLDTRNLDLVYSWLPTVHLRNGGVVPQIRPLPLHGSSMALVESGKWDKGLVQPCSKRRPRYTFLAPSVSTLFEPIIKINSNFKTKNIFECLSTVTRKYFHKISLKHGTVLDIPWKFIPIYFSLANNTILNAFF
jgi:hypothetical protein